MPGVIEAKKRIIEASKKGQKIAIYADYDADGICGAAILYKALKDYFDEIKVVIPDRSEGYGLNKDAVEKMVKEKISLLITVDCGIKNVAEIELAKKNSIDTIVVDHHQLGEKLPKAIIVHPFLGKDLQFKYFSGGGVAFFLSKALSKKEGQEKWLLDLVAISTIADMVPLVHDNRIIAKYGLLVLNKTKNMGLSKLMEIANINKAGAYEVGYMIAPRLNAAGRISLPQKSFDLLINEDVKKIESDARELDQLNLQRQDLLKNGQRDVIEKIKKRGIDKGPFIVIETKFPEGVIGLIAGKITQYFYKPSIVLSVRDGLYKGSARSIPGVNITQLLKDCEHLLESFGGHEQAAGISIKKENLTKFKKQILKLSEKFDEKIFLKKLYIDALIDIDKINISLARNIEKLEPFGQGNYKPIFAVEKASVRDIRYLGKSKDHLSFDLGGNKAIAFCFEEKCWKLEKVKLYDIAFSIEIDRWGGREKVKLIVEDVKER
ncbi:MAG: Single-stranded-DNA-specific exonuclease RecJ [candidate division WS2 bacterium ADurb.Bin280]|uniref:Single-stranded-DNA-specific exonuclease RecJ n=1 Tax=candidate division WS2 bacterium ADurb.Bin280 TaxID=1852829 RepID=A0A1V5SEZ8_9BACT|nr:MAG: Single-stranded-DNA-specific exonuclease RecJ [candidate division WS2 bacterium ADurb.Bin280]